jgi:hypothetical protein
VCGTLVEVKSWLPLGERDRVPDARSVYNKLMSASRQADVVVLNGNGSGIEPEEARRGMLRFAQKEASLRLNKVRVLGADFDLTWERGPAISRQPRAGGPPDPELGGRRRPPDAPDLGR